VKFWQRAYFSTLLLFILCFYISVFLVSNFSYRTNLNNERASSLGEAYFIAASLEKDISAIIQRDGDISAGGYSFFLTYANYYKERGVYLELWADGELLIGNIQGSPSEKYDVAVGEQLSRVVQYDSHKYLLAAGAFTTYSDKYTLVCARDLQAFTKEHNSLARFLLLSGAALAVGLATGLYFLLRRLSKPIEDLDGATGRISAGDYSMRIPVQGKAELAALARHFNSMAGTVETKISELQTAAEQKQRFVDNLAHELRTPLTTIRGYAEYLKNANITEDDRITSLDYVISESTRIEIMANKLLDLALLRNNALKTTSIHLPELFNDVSVQMKSKLTEKKIRLETNCEIDSINGDRILLETLLGNLLDNAVKASGDGASIRLSALTENGCHAVEVRDFGKGIPREHIAKLTEPFYRADKARSRAEGGAGLGLALCEQIAELHKARLTFYSEAGKGTTAKITFTTP
jgi:signal transduction histidine kinase